MSNNTNLIGRRVEVEKSLALIPAQDETGDWKLDRWREKLDVNQKVDCVCVGLVGQWREKDVYAVFFLDWETGAAACRFVQACDMEPTPRWASFSATI